MVHALTERLKRSPAENATRSPDKDEQAAQQAPKQSQGQQKPVDEGAAEFDPLLKALLLLGGNAAYLALIFTIWLKVKDTLGNPLEINLKKYLRSPDYEGRVAFVEQFHADFKKIVNAYAGNEKVFVFMDDLDRCEVPKAAELIKAVNLLIADDSHLIFILGMDRDKVAAGLAVKYQKILPFLTFQGAAIGNDSQFTGRLGVEFGHTFLQKFIQLPFRVPNPNPNTYEHFIRTISLYPSLEKTLGKERVERAVESAGAQVAEKPSRQEVAEALTTTLASSSPSPAQVQKRRQLEMQFGRDSDKVRTVTLMVAKTVSRNPRRLKQFLNLFRLQAYIANETGLFDSDSERSSPLTLEQLAKFVAITLWWPSLLTDFAEDPELLERLSKLASDKPGKTFLDSKGEPIPENTWLSQRRLEELLTFGTKMQGQDYSLSNPTIYQLLYISPQRRAAAP